MRARHIKILATLGVVLGGVSWLAYASLDEGEYYIHVHEVMANPGKWKGKSLQVHGFAVPGTIHEKVIDQRTTRTFDIEYCGMTLPVRHAGIKPDTFKDQAETVITGRLAEENGHWIVQAVEGERGISAKCPSKYDDSRAAPKCPVPAPTSPALTTPASTAASN